LVAVNIRLRIMSSCPTYKRRDSPRRPFQTWSYLMKRDLVLLICILLIFKSWVGILWSLNINNLFCK